VGAGPGDPKLITLRGLECLQQADVIVCDRLAPRALLRFASSGAKIIDAGKSPESEGMSQEQIDQLLAEHALAGRKVCRLKGGDPFLFGRGGEEASFLAEKGIPFEVVPGVTSALAVPAYAGIPATDRRLSSVVAIATGQEAGEKVGSTLPWDCLAKAHTAIFLMGVKNLPELTKRLIEAGRSAAAPAAVISSGTVGKQQTLVASLGEIAERAEKQGIRPPAIFIVGEVVRLRESLNWFEKRPLFGVTVLVTRAREQASELCEKLEELGAETVEFPAIEVAAVAADKDKLTALMERGRDWVVFTSANGVRGFVRQLLDAGMDVRALGRAKLSAIGPVTARAIEALGLRVDFTPSSYTSADIVAEFPDEISSKRFLLPRSAQAPETLADELRQRGAVVEEWAAYQTLPAKDASAQQIRERLESGEIQVVTFASSSAARNLVEAVGAQAISKARVVCIGPATAETARELGLKVDSAAKEHTIVGLVRAVAEALGRR
jgi:uroporphyrinogen III methyltransferase/synthase